MKKIFTTFLVIFSTLISLINVQNIVSAAGTSVGSNIIPNPSVETVSTANTGLPQSWNTVSTGVNTATFQYLSTGEAGKRSISVSITKYTSGLASWYFNPVSVLPDTDYIFQDYYKSAVATTVIAEITYNGITTPRVLGTLPVSTAWKESQIGFVTPANITSITIYHTLTAVGTLQTDNFSLLQYNPNIKVAVASPKAGAILSCTTTLTATITGANFASVAFQVDDLAVGASVTAKPYQVNWDTTTVADGVHTVTAVVTDTYGLTYKSAPVSMTVTNTPGSTGGNITPNGNFLIPSCTNVNKPQDWNSYKWGQNTTLFSYPKTGYSTDRSVEMQVQKYTTGIAEWFPTMVPVKPNSLYTLSLYYKSNQPTDIEEQVMNTDGTTQFYFVQTLLPSSTWKQYTVTLSTYQNTAYMTIVDELYYVGNASISDFSVVPYTPAGFTRGIVTMTFDDGWESTYQNGLPLLQQYGFDSTQYIITSFLNTTDYMTTAQVESFLQDGDEIASHTVTHPDLTSISQADLNSELSQSQQYLQSAFGITVDDFASPFGYYNDATLAAIKQYYAMNRSVDPGYNDKNNFNAYTLKVQNITVDTTPSDVQEWINQAIANKVWLILVYHEVSTTPFTVFNVTPTNLNTELQMMKSSNVVVETMDQAMAELKPQL